MDNVNFGLQSPRLLIKSVGVKIMVMMRPTPKTRSKGNIMQFDKPTGRHHDGDGIVHCTTVHSKGESSISITLLACLTNGPTLRAKSSISLTLKRLIIRVNEYVSKSKRIRRNL
ncbi:hypothetical protein ACFE04_024488 [Oxalis oulophora]